MKLILTVLILLSLGCASKPVDVFAECAAFMKANNIPMCHDFDDLDKKYDGDVLSFTYDYAFDSGAYHGCYKYLIWKREKK